MKFRKPRTTLAETKCEIQMTPTLDIIFQLLIFFILTFKPVVDEGQFAVNLSSVPSGAVAMPTYVPGMGSADEENPPDIQFNPPFRVRLIAGQDGSLAPHGIVMGERRLPSIEYLRFELRNTVRGFAEDFEVIIEADPRLRWEYILHAVNAVSHAGIKKINFGTPPAAPPEPG